MLASTLPDAEVALAGLWPGVVVTSVQAVVLVFVLELALGLQEDVGDFHVGLQRVAELALVVFVAQPPIVVAARTQTVLEEFVEFGHGLQRGLGGVFVSGSLVGRNAGADLFIHQADVALVLLHRHLRPDVGSGGQVGGSLV